VAGRDDHGLQPAGAVVGVDERLRVDADRVGDDPQVAADVQLAAADLVVILLDAVNDDLPYPGALADVVNRKACPGSGLGQRLADGHATSTSISDRPP
jgi:hypothetical protein